MLTNSVLNFEFLAAEFIPANSTQVSLLFAKHQTPTYEYHAERRSHVALGRILCHVRVAPDFSIACHTVD